ncbi:hypothetical protein RFI_15619 [Reticulomyxa filosa]|uniref:Uncharacterized protein n=1 Tax=Reticulomyxa filosa TaxID=46433 RepID=X6N6K8_RETFI|nr:hypothetical protein RFI_15619 [Reticulomyxa filosa]|eukprot:ETO21583.1 hypothetical protein RFI_15619 [Reticulomyxa filosa]
MVSFQKKKKKKSIAMPKLFHYQKEKTAKKKKVNIFFQKKKEKKEKLLRRRYERVRAKMLKKKCNLTRQLKKKKEFSWRIAKNSFEIKTGSHKHEKVGSLQEKDKIKRRTKKKKRRSGKKSQALVKPKQRRRSLKGLNVKIGRGRATKDVTWTPMKGSHCFPLEHSKVKGLDDIAFQKQTLFMPRHKKFLVFDHTRHGTIGMREFGERRGTTPLLLPQIEHFNGMSTGSIPPTKVDKHSRLQAHAGMEMSRIFHRRELKPLVSVKVQIHAFVRRMEIAIQPTTHIDRTAALIRTYTAVTHIGQHVMNLVFFPKLAVLIYTIQIHSLFTLVYPSIAIYLFIYKQIN